MMIAHEPRFWQDLYHLISNELRFQWEYRTLGRHEALIQRVHRHTDYVLGRKWTKLPKSLEELPESYRALIRELWKR